MNWISSVVRPKISSFWTKRDTPKNLWIKCPETGEMVFHRDLETNSWVVPGSGFHMRMPVPARLESLFDNGAFETIPTPQVTQDPLRFRDERRYQDRLKDARAKTGRDDAVTLAAGAIEHLQTTVAIQDFGFMGGSLGMAAGEAIVTGADYARTNGTPFVLFAASGGARMQEGILSLMQMPRTTAAIIALREAGLPYIVVLTNPTTGGVTASYAMLGDVHLAEPGALIGFAGPRVIEQTIREKLPHGFQRSEYLYDHGMVDMVVHRHELKATLGRLLRVMMHQAPVPIALPAPDPEDADGTAAEDSTEVTPEDNAASEPAATAS
ncbi:MAG: acetyl-CoA carboxylase, carboxyltransferase subunit beta [Pseudomonadota bacterium]